MTYWYYFASSNKVTNLMRIKPSKLLSSGFPFIKAEKMNFLVRLL